ncbi:MAG: hypothetical protein H7Y60_09215 [Rhodospirillaceae bacterium]|nr:hypothetical protein [Rhodospirillales bacterium]
MIIPRKPWMPPGPMSAKFYSARDFLSLIMGPVGSAKTTTVLRKIMMLANYQAPSPVDGIRRSKWRVARDTHANVKRTTMATWHKFVPQKLGRLVGEGAGNAPAYHDIEWAHPVDGRPVRLAMEFMGMGEVAAEEAFSSWEGTGVYLNEMNLLSMEVFIQAITRIGRYPGDEHGAATCPMILADLNAPDVTNWSYKLISRIQAGRMEALLEEAGVDVRDLLSDFHTNLAGFYRQPGGREPGAENLENLPKGYYDRQVGMFILADREDMITTKVDNEFGPTREGKPVYKAWKDRVHVAAEELMPVRDIPITVGADAGLNPAAALLQELPTGQVLQLDELVPPPGVTWDAEEFAEHLMRLKKGLKYRGFSFTGWADPASVAGSANNSGKKSWLTIVKANTDFPWRPASTNDIPTRLSAVRVPLVRMVNGEPGFQLSPNCETTREGFNSGYRFPKRGTGDAEYGDSPEKNRFSHIHDALQYGCMGIGLHFEAQARNRPGQLQGSYQAQTDFTVMGGR